MNLAIAIVGPTASGKSAFAMELAQTLDGELICMDCTTIYRHFDIGSSKPSQEDQAKVPHHLLDILSPDEPFSAHDFVRAAEAKVRAIQKKGKTPIVVGGTYFYLRALQNGMYPLPAIPDAIIEAIENEFFEEEGLNTPKMHRLLHQQDPQAAAKIHPNDRYRLVRALAILRSTGESPSKLKAEPINREQPERLWLKYAVTLPRHTIHQKILERTDQMLAGGLIEETAELRKKHPGARALQSIGYAECCRFHDGSVTRQQLRNEIIEKTRQLAKRQITWLRSDPDIRFVDLKDIARIQLEYNNLKSVLELK